MNTQDIFEAEWRACLRAHFFHVIREHDTGNERSLVTVLLETGFTDDEIAAMRGDALAELGWAADLDPTADLSALDEPPPEAEMVIEPPLAAAETLVESLTDSEATEPPVAPDDSEEDEPSGPPVQLSLF
jgi:hypothetical protein